LIRDLETKLKVKTNEVGNADVLTLEDNLSRIIKDFGIKERQ
jgi:hypothetical protein